MRRHALRLLAVLALVLPLSAPGTAEAKAHPQVTVMSRNLYLGSDLTSAVTARDATEFLTAAATIYGTVLFTDYPARAGALADEVQQQRPALVGLQEVARWTTSGTPAPSLDFLAILQAQLAARGLHYDVAVVSDNADIGPVPLVGPACPGPFGSCSVRFQDRDVILVDRGSGVTVSNPRYGRYVAQQVLTTPVGQLSFSRGWTTVDAVLAGHAFRFANSHLETEDAPAVQEAQGRELLAAVRTRGAVVLVGDLNSAADGSTTSTYADLTGDWFRDAAPGVGDTCCQSGTLTNPVSQLHSRIDLVLVHGPVQPVKAVRTGGTPFQSAPPFWASDHAGVAATVRLP